ncbi:MAG: ThuA domain-containing protein [Verrucomicrobia bacterium]|nr:ThuA domain-containing protein [Verrucomicrobiota bacterium]
MKYLVALMILFGSAAMPLARAGDWVVYEGHEGPGRGKHIVFVSGDEEYRSEEALPMLARILAVRQGFKCTVLFALNPADGTIDPNNQTNIVGLRALQTADLLVLFTRFREPPDDQMKYLVEYVNSGKPILGIRTATHAFAFSHDKQSPYAKFDWQSRVWPGGFGRQVLGETWVNHWGRHGIEATRGVIATDAKDDPILRGVADIFGKTDVYEAYPPKDAKILVWGQVLKGMNPSDPPADYRRRRSTDRQEQGINEPMMPIIWRRTYTGESGKTSRIVCTTIGAAVDLECEDLRRLLVNACYWGLGMEDQIPAKADVDYVGAYHPTYFGFGKFKRGMRPSDFELK